MSSLFPLSFFLFFPLAMFLPQFQFVRHNSHVLYPVANSSFYEHSITDFSLQRKHASRSLCLRISFIFRSEGNTVGRLI
jgi:hypothetical protein